MSPTGVVRSAAALALGGTATVLSGTARALSFLAGRLRGTVEDAAPAPVRGVVERAADVAEEVAGRTSEAAHEVQAETRDAADGRGAEERPDRPSTATEGAQRLEDLAGMTSGAPPAVDELFPAESAPGPAAGAAAPGPSRTFESQTAVLASKPAGEVVRAVRGMSTDELEALLDYETSHRKRKTVLGAIERELAPPTEELVYSSPDR